jgi:hypothetical protein
VKVGRKSCRVKRPRLLSSETIENRDTFVIIYLTTRLKIDHNRLWYQKAREREASRR